MIRNVIIATFAYRKDGKRTPLNGMIEPLLYFFDKNVDNLLLLEGSHPGSDTVSARFETYKKGRLKTTELSYVGKILSPILKMQNTNSTQTIFKLRDFLSVIEIAIRYPKRYDLFIGLESIYALGGILLRKIGLVKYVVYYVSDYAPNRFSNKTFNDIYLMLDRFCCRNADAVWDVSPAMLPARVSKGFKKSEARKHILVPNALFPKQIDYLPLKKVAPYSIVFAGTFGPENGPDLAVKAMKYIVKKFPIATLHMIGGGDTYEDSLKKMAKDLGIDKNIIFHGFIKDAIKVSMITKKSMIGLAPYAAIPRSPRFFADATKIRLYFGAGLPAITTQVPPLGKDPEIKKGVVVTIDNEKEIAKAIIKLFNSKAQYREMRKSAINYAKSNTWENTYTKALKQMGLSINDI